MTENLIVKGCLEVTDGIHAKHISGGGVIRADCISADVIHADVLDANLITCRRLIAKQVSAPEVCASESAAVSCYLSATHVETGRLTVTISDILMVDAGEVINLTPKKRSLFGTLLASALRAFWLFRFAKPVKGDAEKVMDADYAPAEDAAPQGEVIADADLQEFVPEDFTAEENADFELNRIVAQFKLARASGYTLRLIPGTPEENAPVFDSETEKIVRPAA